MPLQTEIFLDKFVRIISAIHDFRLQLWTFKISPCSVTAQLGEETKPQHATTSFQVVVEANSAPLLFFSPAGITLFRAFFWSCDCFKEKAVFVEKKNCLFYIFALRLISLGKSPTGILILFLSRNLKW